MIPWYWLGLAVMIGAVIGIGIIALVSGNGRDD